MLLDGLVQFEWQFCALLLGNVGGWREQGGESLISHSEYWNTRNYINR